MYLAYPMKIAAGLGFIALVLLAGGNAKAQVGCLGGVGYEELSRTVKAIEAVNVQVESITEVNVGDSKALSIDYSIQNEHSCIAGKRSWACAKITAGGMETREICSDSAPTRRGTEFQTDFEVGDRPADSTDVTAQVRVRYYGAGGAFTSWSPEYRASVLFVLDNRAAY